MPRAGWLQRTSRRAAAALLVLLGAAACGRRLDLPQEPDVTGGPAGEVAYVKKYLWEGMPALTDLVLTRGQVLYGVDPAGSVRSWFSDSATPRENTSRNLPATVIVDSDTLRQAVQLCEGVGSTLWVAYALPRLTLLQWDVAVVPPVPVDSGLVRDVGGECGGVAADADSGFVYVADRAASTVAKFRPSRFGGRRVTTLCGTGDGDHFVREPHGIYAFGDSLLVADTGKAWVQVVSTNEPLAGRGQVTGPSQMPLQLSDPRDVWVDPTGFFYVADTGNGRVLKLRRNGLVKENVTELDADAAAHPNTIAASDTRVWVVDPERGRLTIYQINTSSEELP